MILEQRYGAAQIALRTADALLEHATTSTTQSVTELRCMLFRTAWYAVSQRHAVGSLVSLCNRLLTALDPCVDSAAARDAAIAVIDTFRSELIHRVPDTAQQSMSVLNQQRRVMLYGYSTTVLYALQHARRNGQRIDVISLAGGDAPAHQALVERIEAIGLSVTALPYAAYGAAIESVDAVVVGADTLDQRGLTNTSGTAALAAHAHAVNVPFYSFCTSEKFLPDAFFSGELTPWPCADITDAPSTLGQTSADVVGLDCITGVITERGSLPAPAIEAWLAAERLHPWLVGRGRSLLHHQSHQR
jgi:translation initiation factor eIF-2B subunit delta